MTARRKRAPIRPCRAWALVMPTGVVHGIDLRDGGDMRLSLLAAAFAATTWQELYRKGWRIERVTVGGRDLPMAREFKQFMAADHFLIGEAEAARCLAAIRTWRRGRR